VVVGALGAVFRHEGVLHHDVVAAGGAQAQHVPVVLDAVVRLGQQEGGVLEALAAVALGQQAAQEDPFAVLDPLEKPQRPEKR
jgi:hypothetical protein